MKKTEPEISLHHLLQRCEISDSETQKPKMSANSMWCWCDWCRALLGVVKKEFTYYKYSFTWINWCAWSVSTVLNTFNSRSTFTSSAILSYYYFTWVFSIFSNFPNFTFFQNEMYFCLTRIFIWQLFSVICAIIPFLINNSNTDHKKKGKYIQHEQTFDHTAHN